jgi:hypothetical protein
MEKKTADPTKYMREYKKKRYDEDPAPVILANKNNYYKRKFKLTKSDLDQFQEYTPNCALALHHLGILRDEKPALFLAILERLQSPQIG